MSSLSDPVVMREDGRVIYTLASVVDDIDHGITHIIRGEDHVTNSAAQIQLFEALGSAAPMMGHVALLAGVDGEGLSKRLGSLSIGALRQDGIEPMAIASLLARLGTADPVIPQRHMTSVIDRFDLGKFGRATAKFDPSELAKLNSQIVQELDFANVESRLANIGVTANAEFWLAVRGNLTTVDEARVWWDICTQPIKPVIEASAVTNAAAALLPAGDLDSQIWSPWTKSIAAETGAKGKFLFMPLRLALTGRDAGPEIAPLLAIMGRERVIKRLQGDAA
jgi:glutamyl-tRNA synthetase